MHDQVTPVWSGELIDNVVREFLVGLKEKEAKLTVSDTLRLLDLQKQLAHQELREVRVRWVEYNPDPLASNT